MNYKERRSATVGSACQLRLSPCAATKELSGIDSEYRSRAGVRQRQNRFGPGQTYGGDAAEISARLDDMPKEMDSENEEASL